METRFMQVMFSATAEGDEELKQQVADDVETAKEEGSFDDEEVTYVNLGSGKVLVIDKANGESTVIEQNPEDPEEFSLEGFENEQELDKYLHTLDGITPNEELDGTEPTENFEDHMTGEDVISPNLENGGLNLEAGHEQSVEDVCPECGQNPCECGEEEEHHFSLGTENEAILKIFSDEDLYLRIFSDVVTEEKPALVGDLKIEVDEECPDAVIVTDVESGDQAKVTFDEEEGPVVSELQKECSEEEDYEEEDEEEDGEQYEPYFVVGVNPESSELVEAPVYEAEEAEELADRLEGMGLEAVEVFDNEEDARDHAFDLLQGAGVSEMEQLAEPQEHTFSDCTLYVTRFFSDAELEEITPFMERLFSEAEDNVTDAQDEIEEAIAEGKQTEDEDTVITPIDEETAVVLDKDTDEYTKVTLDGGELEVEKISEEEADELTQDVEFEEDEDEEDDEEQKEYSTRYIYKLFSDVESQDEVIDAIKEGEEVDNEDEVITPIDEETAVVYDKDTDEYTKVTLEEGDDLSVDEISEEEAHNLIDEATEAEEVAKKFSTFDRYFAEVAEQMAAPAPAPQSTVAPEVDPITGNPVEAPIEEAGAEVPVQSVEGIEDKALAAVQSIQEAANNAVLAIQEAKEAPAPGEEADLREAQFCESDYYVEEEAPVNDTLGSWLGCNF